MKSRGTATMRRLGKMDGPGGIPEGNSIEIVEKYNALQVSSNDKAPAISYSQPMNKLRLAFIGCGGITRAHLSHGLESFTDVEFVGWNDLNLEAAQQLAEKHGGRAFGSMTEMLDQTSPDAVYIMLPPFAHGEAERAVIERKIPFFVEKPIHLNFAEAREFSRRIAELKLITGVGYMNRFQPGVQKVKDILRTQPLVMLQGGWLTAVPAGELVGIWKWWVQKDKSGGQLVEQTTHTTDLALYLGGEITEVYAVPVTTPVQRPDYFTIEEGSMVSLRYKSGAVANIISSVATRVGGGVHLTCWGTDFRADFTGWAHDLALTLPESEAVSIQGEKEVFRLEDRAFLDSVRSGKQHPILASYEEGVAAAAVAEAANLSFASKVPVQVKQLFS